MVKNTGGNKSKKQARKFTGGGGGQPAQNSIRYAKEEGEMYAAVTNVYSGTNCKVMCMDGKSRSCIVRSKFIYRAKRENAIAVGGWLLVGVRDWEVRTDGVQKCDLLEVYSLSEKEKIKETENRDLRAMMSISEQSNDFIFSSSARRSAEDDEEEEEEEDDDDDDVANENEIDNDITKPPTLAETVNSVLALQKKEKKNITEQLDWMKIDVNDI